MRGHIDLVSRQRFDRLLSRDLHSVFSTVVRLDRLSGRPFFLICEDNFRTRQNIDFTNALLEFFDPEIFLGLDDNISFVLQGEDCPKDVNSVSYQRQKSYRHVCLLPDFEYVGARGHADFCVDSPTPWSSRLSRVIWRGSTTGKDRLRTDEIDILPRYRMVRLANALPQFCDVAFTHVVQAASLEDHSRLLTRLYDEQLIRPFIDIKFFANYKYFVQIDGNGNSWRLAQKLRLGCCMLLVDSQWQLYHEERLRPWQHFVPVRADLSDFAQKIEWCIAHDGEAEAIGRRAREHAIAIDFPSEMRDALWRVRGAMERIDW